MVIGTGAPSSGSGGMVDPESPEEGQEGNPHRTLGKQSHPTLTYPIGRGVGGFMVQSGPRTFVAPDMPQLSPGALGFSKQGAMTQLSVLSRVNPMPDSGAGSSMPYIAIPDHDLNLRRGGSGGPAGPITVNPRDLQARFGTRVGGQLEALLRDIGQP